MAPDWPESPAAVALRELQQVAGECLTAGQSPNCSPRCWRSRKANSSSAGRVRGLHGGRGDARAAAPTGAELAQAVGLDMAAWWWQPTAAKGCFKARSPRPVILQAVGEYAPDSINLLAEAEEGRCCQQSRAAADGTALDACHHQSEGPEAVPEEAGAGYWRMPRQWRMKPPWRWPATRPDSKRPASTGALLR